MEVVARCLRSAGRRTRVPWQRGQLTAFVEQHHLVWDLVMGVLTVVYVALAFRQDNNTAAENYAIGALAILFLAEFSARCYDASSRLTYLRSHWLDLITAVPVPGIPGLRILRLLRLLRFMKVGMILRRVLMDRGWRDAGLIWPTLVLFWIGSALALWLVEHDAPGANITSFPGAMTAAFMTASTLGFGAHGQQPVTQDGQIIAGLTVFFALGLWGFASSKLTQMWLEGRRSPATDEMRVMREELHLMREQLTAITDTLTHPIHRVDQVGSSDSV